MVPDRGQEFVYHYTRASTAIEHIFPTMKLRLGSPADTNDPIEAFTQVMAEGGGDAPDRKDALFAAREVILGSRIACFTRDARSSPGWQRHRMWAQYAENHHGICLCLDRAALEANAKKLQSPGRSVIARSVQYAERVDHSLDMQGVLDDGAPGYVARYFREHPSPHYFTKLSDWEGETEYRLLLTGSPSTRLNEYLHIEEALCGVYVGARFSDGYRVCIEDACSRLRIPARRIDYMADLGWEPYFDPDP